MYQVIIVEDEYLALMGIKMIVDWQALRLELVGEAANGEEAYALYLRHRPHIIITDLRMPVMDGIGLIAKVHDDHGDKETRFIILSCVDEFDLVQKALNYNVSHYFLKIRMNREEMNAVLRQLVEELDQYYSSLSVKDRAENEAFAEDVLKSAYHGRLEEYNAARFLSSTGLYADNSTYQCVLIKTFRTNTTAMADFTHPESIEVINAVNEAVHLSACRMYPIDSNLYCLLILIPSRRIHDLQKDPSAIAEFVREILHKRFDLLAHFGISNDHQKANELSNALTEAKSGLEGCFFTGMAICPFSLSRRKYSTDPFYLNEVKNSLISDGKLDQETRSLCLERLTASLTAGYSTAEEYKEALHLLLFWFLAKVQLPDSNLDLLARNCKNRIADSPTLKEAIPVLTDFIRICTSHVSFGKKIPEVILAVTDFIHEHYTDDIRLSSIADWVHLNPSYLSSLFKQVMNSSFVSYINLTRIKKARTLLVSTDAPVSEIALSVGFRQDEYFYKMFKRIVGLTPSEYRSRFSQSPAGKTADQGDTA